MRLFDSTEIDEILTLRVLTLTEEEKAAGAGHRSAGGGDHRPLRRRCRRSSWQRLHGVLRDPHGTAAGRR